MSNNIKRNVLKAAAGVLALGTMLTCTACELETEEQKIYGKTVVTQNDFEYRLDGLYLLIGENDNILCYMEFIDGKTAPQPNYGTPKSNPMNGSGCELDDQLIGFNSAFLFSYGLVTSNSTVCAYVSVNDNTVIALEGFEAGYGFNAVEAKSFISYEEALTHNFMIPAEEFNELLTNDKEAILEIKNK